MIRNKLFANNWLQYVARHMPLEQLCSTFFLCLLIVGAGCDQKTEKHNQLESANERINDQNKLIVDRDQKLEKIDTEREQEIKRIHTAHENELRAIKDTHQQQVANLESTIADLKLQLSQSEKERMALDGLIKQPERLAKVQEVSYSVERTVWMVLCVCFFGVSAFIASQYFQLRARRRADIALLVTRCS